MRELFVDEVDQVDGGVRTFIRWVASNVAWSALVEGVKAALNEPHTDGDSCDYYNNMPPAVQ